jgi:hypothetical protein
MRVFLPLTLFLLIAAAQQPAKQDLAGKWFMTEFVMTSSFSGHDKDFVQSGCDGIKRNGELEWALKFSAKQDGHLAANSKKIGDSLQDRRIRFEPDGTLILEQDDGGDSMTVYRCRTTNSKTLVCVYNGAPGHGMEFRKQEK